MRGHSEQSVLQGFAEAAVHRQCDHQRGHAGRHANHGKQGDQSQDRRAIGRSEVTPRHEPFEAHGARYPLRLSGCLRRWLLF